MTSSIRALRIKTLGMMTSSIRALSIMTLSLTTLSIMTLSLTTLSITKLVIMTFKHYYGERPSSVHYAECHYSEKPFC
jgi:hypothetical protein